MKVLIADDDPAARDFVSRALSADGHEVIIAEDGADAFAKFEAADAIDVLLSDISMPVMDGVMLAQKVLSAAPGTKIILMSGLESELARVDDLAAKGVITLTKPFSLDDVRALIKQA